MIDGSSASSYTRFNGPPRSDIGHSIVALLSGLLEREYGTDQRLSDVCLHSPISCISISIRCEIISSPRLTLAELNQWIGNIPTAPPWFPILAHRCDRTRRLGDLSTGCAGEGVSVTDPEADLYCTPVLYSYFKLRGEAVRGSSALLP